MSQMLKGFFADAEDDGADDTTLEGAPTPAATELRLRVTDRDVLAELAKHPAGAARDEFALEALKIGVLALRRASTQLDGDIVQREMKAMLASLRQQLDEHARGAHERLAGSLKEYFDPSEGRFTERVQRLTADDGDLARVLKGALGGDDSQLARTLLSHVGENSPLMKVLSPDQSQGLLAALRTNVEGQLQQQRERLLKEFSLDNPDGALHRLVSELTAKHGDLSKDLQGKIDAVVKEFSLDEENSALSRLVQNVDRAQRIITSEFSLDNEQSALRRLKTELTTILEAHVKTNADFQQEVRETLAKLDARREAEARGTQHGATFEAAVVEFVQQDAQRRGDVAESTGATTGLIKNCKIGDAVVELGPDCAAAGAKIVVEAKEEGRYSLGKAREEIEQARKNRGAAHGVFVFSQVTAPTGLAPLARYGADVVVVWDAQDPATDAYLLAGLEIARALCVQAGKTRERESVDFEPIDRAILDIEKRVGNLDKVRKSAETIRSSSESILERVRIDQDALQKQVEALRGSMDIVRRAVGEAADD